MKNAVLMNSPNPYICVLHSVALQVVKMWSNTQVFTVSYTESTWYNILILEDIWALISLKIPNVKQLGCLSSDSEIKMDKNNIHSGVY